MFGERKYICNNASMNMFQIFILIQELLFAVTGWYDPIVYQHSYMKSKENCSLFPSIQKNLHVNMPRWWFQIFFGIFTPRKCSNFEGRTFFKRGLVQPPTSRNDDIQTPAEKVFGPPKIYLKHQTSEAIWMSRARM